MADLYLVAVGPAVSHLVPHWFDVVPVEGAGASAIRRDDGHDIGRCNGYGGVHPGKHLLNVLYGLGECGVGGNEAFDGEFFLNGHVGKV